MPDELLTRRLAAILAADVVGYSRLMDEDEAGTHARLKALRAGLIDPALARHGGRIFKTTGDGFLAEFASAVDAVAFALAVRHSLAARELANRPLELRIGINLGDVIVDGDDVFGGGVNVAARLETFAQPGQICVSEDVQRQVRGKLEAAFDDLGDQSFKNIAEPVRVFAVRAPGEAAASARAGRPRGEASSRRPSIAVMPFENIGGEAEQEFFADGITEDVITELSRFPDLFVIARNSTFAYKGKHAKVQDVGRELGVAYVVEGSVRKSGNRVRVTAQLIDAATEAHIWAQRYDREIADIFDIQDEIARVVAATVPGRLEAAHAERIRRKPPADMAAYDYVLSAKLLHHHASRENNAEALRLIGEAIRIDPEFAQAHGWKACILGQAAARGYAPDGAKLLDSALESVATGLALDENDIECNRVQCEAYMSKHQLDRAQVHHERVFRLNPNDPRIVAQKGELYVWLGRAEEAVSWLSEAIRLDPYGAPGRAHLLGRALYATRRYAEAAEWYRQSPFVRFEPQADLAACYAQMGDEAAAREHASEALRLNPAFSIAAYVGHYPYRREEDRDHHREGLAKAGLPA
jgi:adenylate cyclase